MKKQFEKSSYKFLWSSYQSLRVLEMDLTPFLYYRNFDWNKVDNIIMVAKNNTIQCFHSIKDLERDKEIGKKLFNEKYQNEFIKGVNKNHKKSWQLFSKLKNINYKNKTNDELYNLLIEIFNQWSVQISYFRASQEDNTHYLIEKIKEKYSNNEISLLLLPTEIDIINKEIIDWQKLVKKAYSKKIIIKHIEKYPWIVAVHFTVDDVLKTMKDRYYSSKNFLLKTDNILQEKYELKIKQKKLLEKVDAKIIQIVLFLQKLGLTRSKTKACWAGTDYYIMPLLSEIAKRTNEDIYDLNKYYLNEDIKNLLNGKKLSEKEKNNRKQCFVGLLKNKKIKYTSGIKAEQVVKKELKDLYKIQATNLIRGTIANKGKIIAIARVLWSNNIKQAQEFRNTFLKGQILVTQMTQPNIVDIASRAGGIITNEGVMLSHAAIISREFNVPCMVGTHIATDVIRDGDLVEVDAERGIVKILKRDKI